MIIPGWEASMPAFARAAAAAAMFLALPFVGPVRADVLISVDKASQRMDVSVDGVHRYTWPVSTGIRGTPSGTYRPQSFDRYHRSSMYGNAPMPYSIFYSGNFAIHGTTQISRLGGRASHGCIRLHPSNAAVLFSLVRQQSASTRIVIH
jgi:lipoprotein-anchoring transpeptidase ErfK/SrfK